MKKWVELNSEQGFPVAVDPSRVEAVAAAEDGGSRVRLASGGILQINDTHEEVLELLGVRVERGGE